MPPRVWFALDTGFLGDHKICELGSEHGPGGPLVMVACYSAAKLQDDGGRFRMGYRALARHAFLKSARVARLIVARASQIELIELVAMETDGFEGVIPRYSRWQISDPRAAERKAKSRRKPGDLTVPVPPMSQKSHGPARDKSGHVTPLHRTETKTETATTTTQEALVAEFDDWLEHHQALTGRVPPKPKTVARGQVFEAFRARRSEDYSLDDLKSATHGAFNDAHRREHGYFGCESILRPTKVHDLVEKGRMGNVTPLNRKLQNLEAMRRWVSNEDGDDAA